jgi:hypothetical protein
VHRLESFRASGAAILVGGLVIAGFLVWRRSARTTPEKPPA